jgi:cysteine desulfurase / selenocysteine lyase
MGLGSGSGCIARIRPLPRTAVEVVSEAVAEKQSPWRIRDESFAAVPRRLKQALGELIGAAVEEVILGNSTTYGLNLLAQGLPLEAGDEILLVEGDFPATVYPWLPLRERGVRVRRLRPPGGALTAEALAAELTPATRALCSSWAFSFSGVTIDLATIGEVCREHGVWFLVNGSQAVGARPIDLGALPVDALVSCGFKWLCGPYATGFAWIRPELRESLTYRQAYWLTHQLATFGDFDRAGEYELGHVGAAAYDVFCTANFFNFSAWTASVKLLIEAGIERVSAHDQTLVQQLIDGLDEGTYELLSPRHSPARSTLVYVTHRQRDLNESVHRQLERAGIDIALRDGNLRFSPHLYNTAEDIDRALDLLPAIPRPARRPR